MKQIKNDKRRGPYNLWVWTVSIVIFLIFAFIGGFIMNVGIKADSGIDEYDFKQFKYNLDVRCVENEECNTENIEIVHRNNPGYYYGSYYQNLNDMNVECLEDYKTYNWQAKMSTGIIIILGVIIIIIGIGSAIWYYDEKSWKKEDFKKK